jgi:outer membrane protein assembly factor BamB
MRRSLSIVGVALLVVLLAGCNLLDWPQHGADGGNTGWARLSLLDTHTVGSLQQAWVAPSPNGPATLAVADGAVFASSPLGQFTFTESPPSFTSPPPPLEAHSVTDGSVRWSAGGDTISESGLTTCITDTAATAPVVFNGRYDYLTQSEDCATNTGTTQSCTGITQSIDATTGTEYGVTLSPSDCITSDPVAASDGTVYFASTPDTLASSSSGPNEPSSLFFEGSDGSVFIVPGTIPGVNDGGALSTPAVDGNSLFAVVELPGITGSSYLMAFDRATHQVLWSQAIQFPGFSPPTPSVANGQVYVANRATASVQAFDAATGRPLWSTTLPDTPGSNAPATNGSAVFVTTSTGSMLLALDATSGALLWQASLGGGSLFAGSPSVANDVVFVGTQDGRLLAFDATGKSCSTATGCSPIWSATLSGDTGNSRPVISGDAVYISAANGTAGSNLYKFSLFGR